MHVDGVDGYIEIPDDDSLTPTNITISTWIKLGISNNFAGIFDKYTLSPSYIFRMYNLTVQYESSSGTGPLNSIKSLQVNKWHHVLVKFDSATGLKYIYIDGVYDSSAAGNSPLNDSNFVAIGRDYTNRYFNGMIDEVALWSRALSDAEILQLYRRGANRIKYQIRSCASANCADQDAITPGNGWKGPGGNYLTYFSEL